MIRDEDAASVAPMSQESGFRIVAPAIYDLHPHSVPSTSKASSSGECEFEGLFASSAKDSKES